MKKKNANGSAGSKSSRKKRDKQKEDSLEITPNKLLLLKDRLRAGDNFASTPSSSSSSSEGPKMKRSLSNRNLSFQNNNTSVLPNKDLASLEDSPLRRSSTEVGLLRHRKISFQPPTTNSAEKQEKEPQNKSNLVGRSERAASVVHARSPPTPPTAITTNQQQQQTGKEGEGGKNVVIVDVAARRRRGHQRTNSEPVDYATITRKDTKVLRAKWESLIEEGSSKAQSEDREDEEEAEEEAKEVKEEASQEEKVKRVGGGKEEKKVVYGTVTRKDTKLLRSQWENHIQQQSHSASSSPLSKGKMMMKNSNERERDRLLLAMKMKEASQNGWALDEEGEISDEDEGIEGDEEGLMLFSEGNEVLIVDKGYNRASVMIQKKLQEEEEKRKKWMK
ncbi:hypothetical protein QOT17_006078 [Balamuthia mandrillaris]